MVTVGDLNNDNRLDIAIANYGAHNMAILFGYGDGRFSEQIVYPMGNGSQPSAVAIGDFNSDNRSDIVLADFRSGNITIFLRDSSQPFLSMSTYLTGNNSHPQSMVIEDFNNDDRLDIMVTNYGNDNIGILLGYGNGTFMAQTTFSTGIMSMPCAVAAGHFNNDSLLDIAVVNAGKNTISIFVGYGNGMFLLLMTYSTGDSSSPYSIAVTDFDNDNRLDITVANSGSTDVYVLFGFGNGTFGSPKSYLLGYGSLLYSVAVGDFNRDSWIDIAVANYGTETVDILLQVCNST